MRSLSSSNRPLQTLAYRIVRKASPRFTSELNAVIETFATKRHFLALPYNIPSESPATRVARPKGALPLTRNELFLWRPPDFGLAGAVFFGSASPNHYHNAMIVPFAG